MAVEHLIYSIAVFTSYCVPGTMLDAGNTAVNKLEVNSALLEQWEK